MLSKKHSIVLLQGVFAEPVFDLLKKHKSKKIFVLEGRPSLQAAKKSCRALLKRKIKPTLISDNMAGILFYKNLVKEVWIAYYLADKKGALGHIGSLIPAVLAKRHKIPVKLFPADKGLRLLGKGKEIFYFNGKKAAPKGIKGYVPLVEWIPRKYITKIHVEAQKYSRARDSR